MTWLEIWIHKNHVQSTGSAVSLALPCTWLMVNCTFSTIVGIDISCVSLINMDNLCDASDLTWSMPVMYHQPKFQSVGISYMSTSKAEIFSVFIESRLSGLRLRSRRFKSLLCSQSQPIGPEFLGLLLVSWGYFWFLVSGGGPTRLRDSCPQLILL